MRITMPFKGTKIGHGGARVGAGRPPNWFKERCKELGYTIDTPEMWAKVASGEQIHPKLPLKMSDVLEASRLLTEYGEGKALQTSEVKLNDARPEASAIERSIRDTQDAIKRIESIIGSSANGTNVDKAE